MATEVLEALFRVNLAAAAAVALVLLLRQPLRRAAGSRVAYALWLAVPVAAAGSLLPARKIVAALPVPATDTPALGERAGVIAGSGGIPAAGPAVPTFDWPALALALWAAGAVAGMAWLVWRQRRFLARVAGAGSLAPGVGPAVVGAIAPKILLPADFDDRFTARERDVVLAHEEFHLRQGHAQTNALVLVSQCVNWFNPALHLAARAIRLDQEMACDEAVVTRFPNARRTYAEAMLKTQLTRDLVLGCYWPATGSALRQRLSLLKAPRPSRKAAAAGLTSILALTAAAGLGAWAAQPPTTVFEATVPRASTQATADPAPPIVAEPIEPAPEPMEAAAPPPEALPPARLAEDRRAMAEAAESATDMPERLEAARKSLVEEVELTRRRLENRSARAAPDRVQEMEAEHQAAQSALRMFDAELERFGGVDGLIRITSSASEKAKIGYAQAVVARDRYARHRREPQPKRDPAVIERGSRIHVHTRLTLPSGKWIGGTGVFTRNGATDAQDGNYSGDPRYSIASSIRQVGDAVEVRPKVMLEGKLIATGLALIPSGETVSFALDNGMIVTTTATIRRPRTPKPCCQT